MSEADEWLSRAEGMLAGVLRPEGDPFARSLYDDTRYRLAAVRTTAAPSVGQLLAAHRAALEVIGPSKEWLAGRAQQWTWRELRHLRVLLAVDSPEPELEERLLTALGRLPFDARWLRFAAQILRTNAENERLSSAIGRVCLRRAAEARDTLRSGQSLHRLALLIVEPGRWSESALPWANEAAQGLVDPQPNDVGLLAEAVDVLARQADRDRAVLRGLTGLGERVLAALRPSLARYSGDEWVERLYALSLRMLAWNCLACRTQSDEPVEALRSLKTAIRRIDGLYRAHLVDVEGSSRWLWCDWVEWRIACAQRLGALRLRRAPREQEAERQGAALQQLIADCDSTTAGHPASHAAALNVYRYLWDWEKMRARLRALTLAVGGFADRLRMADLALRALSAVAFAPPLLRAPDVLLDEEEMRLLRHVLAEVAAGWTGHSAREWVGLMQQALAAPDDGQLWVAIVQRGEAVFGPPRQYWQSIVDRLESEEPRAEGIVAQLTDQRVLNLTSRLFRFGCGNPALPEDLRLQLGELAVAAAAGADLWYGSQHEGVHHPIARFRLGTAIGLALAVSPNQMLFGEGGAAYRDPRPRSWVSLMERELGAAHSHSVGRYHQHTGQVWRCLRELLGQPARSRAGAATEA